MFEPRVRAENVKATADVPQSLGADLPTLLTRAGLPPDPWDQPEDLQNAFRDVPWAAALRLAK